MSSLKYWLWLTSLNGLKEQTRLRLIDYFDDPEEIYFAREEDYREALGYTGGDAALLLDKRMDSASSVMEQCANLNVSMMTIQDADYPARLRNIYNPPFVLYVLGRLPAVDEEAAIAIVGTRKATPYGIKMGRQMGHEITNGGGLVVSGLAEGVDTAGSMGALYAGGACVGVLGTAINEVYPKSNRSLFEDVISVGSVVSEYPPGYPTAPGNFPQRNRIISGLSAGVVIIEAPKRSGALITANLALEQGRDVFVVPANADSATSAGSNELMRDAAKPVMSGWDVLCEYDRIYPDKIVKPSALKVVPEDAASSTNTREEQVETGENFVKLRESSTKKVIDKDNDKAYIDIEKLATLTEDQLLIVAALENPNLPLHVDEIIEQTGLSAQTVLSGLTVLQIKGIVSESGAKKFTLGTT